MKRVMKFKFQLKLTVFVVLMKVAVSEIVYHNGSDFSKIVHTLSFIDKTRLIKDLFEQEMVLLTAPRGFGKSTCLDMVKRFLEISLDENSEREPPFITDNYELFKRKDLRIVRYPYDLFFQEHFGMHPVLYIDYSDLCEVKDFDGMLSTFKEIIYKTFLPHRYLLKNKELVWFDAKHKKVFSKYSHPLEYKKLSEENITRSFFWLSRVLCEHYSKRVFLLIDEYNTFLECLPERNVPDSDRIIEFVRSINDDLIKFNAFIDHAFLVGIPLQNNTDVWPDNLIKFEFLGGHEFRGYLGVTEKEIVKSLRRKYLEKVKIKQVKKKLSDVTDFYTVNNETVYSFSAFLDTLKYVTNIT